MSRRPVICVQLNGGLGNQLFQYAAGRALAESADAEFFVAPKMSGRLAHAGSALVDLGIDCQEWPHKASPLFELISRGRRGLRRVLGMPAPKLPTGWRGSVYIERGFAFDQALFSLRGDWFLVGYFQSERYFAPIADALRTEIAATLSSAPVTPENLERATDPDAVSVHVRCGDYGSDPATAAVHGMLDIAYYDRARDHLKATAGATRFLVFSDDLTAARARLAHWTDVEFIDGGSRDGDFRLMAACRHHIIANSTFSWWGAWAGKHEGGITVAPRQWFSEEKQRTTDTGDLFPPDWIQL
ncbi:alpha-1,2-fucosyltransferase [Breoghania sp. L-A4]|uniref:alpha-1,2-fucosyltransferase n=1 Tax=Breoghania sp. L-A4 TaxID=2304600 RepID=UPI000E35CB04|nr:alpha-1,2-fucosyltransferase [Breoghania sp. L-A4]AXS40629.1 alpha-1,2-fucosyltransferase [Breoghania sp. L-A4]